MRWNRMITSVCVFLLQLIRVLIGVVAAFILGAFILGKLEAPLSVNLDDNYSLSPPMEQFAEVTYKGERYTEISIRPTSYRLELESLPISNVYLIISMIVLLGAFYYLVHVLIKLLKSIEERQFFSLQNVKRIRIAGVMVICYSVLSWIYGYLVRYLLIDYLDIKGVFHMSSRISTQSSFFNSYLFLGLMILLVANAFEHGVKLKEEQELTI
ncbi:DUF2975 domain-containing protein [Roseivirga sp. E12]|uniref:DUF2975 domain-containing protein n=1 Tax=Roseivirga sp. E12 TaxID=2819237 RepID=UPI001ABC634D|nr:DUF2975 domain-containing protein [Roseivirga sp. E12]MBO3699239.1 DUF2975 domain-containing protein [Roseivirga sp. E12]